MMLQVMGMIQLQIFRHRRILDVKTWLPLGGCHLCSPRSPQKLQDSQLAVSHPPLLTAFCQVHVSSCCFQSHHPCCTALKFPRTSERFSCVLTLLPAKLTFRGLASYEPRSTQNKTRYSKCILESNHKYLSHHSLIKLPNKTLSELPDGAS